MGMSTLTRPMGEFNPTEPAILHDRLGDNVVPWTGEMSEDWLRRARPRSDGLVEWDGLLFDGWDEPLGG